MKKLFLLMATAFVAMSVNAQVYLGGSVNITAWSTGENAGDRSETVFKLLPEIGYNLNDKWAIGTVFGYENNKWSGVEGLSESAFTFSPYARYTFLKTGKVNFFLDGGIGFTTASDADWTEVTIGVKPGLAVNLTDKLSFVSHLGFFGYDNFNPDGDKNNMTSFGLDLSSTNLTFGLFYNF